MTELAKAYYGKRVLLTGHTGFKGSWLSLWLSALGAETMGYALPPPTEPDMFGLCGVAGHLEHVVADVRDRARLCAEVQRFQPDVVFHLAAQPIVQLSYHEPMETLETNIIGTANLLQAVRHLKQACAVVIVTSDKCYENRGWMWGYRESDPMGGSDPYSMSKGACELVIASWRRTYFADPQALVRLASARAGNVIGGGDWAQDRIVADAISALSRQQPIGIRNPAATRPWQHVLECLGGYLLLGKKLMEPGGHAYTDGWNFGPRTESVCTVARLAELIVGAWGSGSWQECRGSAAQAKEASVLSLSYEKAHRLLGWSPAWSLEETVARTVEWYKAWRDGGADLEAFTLQQIEDYTRAARW